MSHEIESHDTIVLGSNKAAWHGLGTVFPGLLSPRRVFAEGVGMRSFEEFPIEIDGNRLDGVKGILGVTAKGERVPLSVVGDGFGILRSETVFETLEEVYGGRAVVETAGTLRNGKREFVLCKRDNWEVTAGDLVHTFDLWLNRHDGSGCFELHRTNVRVVCANTWKLAVSNGVRALSVRHTRNVESLVKGAVLALSKMELAEAEMRRKTRELAATPMSRGESVSFFERLLDVTGGNEAESTRTVNQLGELDRLFARGTGNEGKTRWDGFNAVTEFADHSRSTRVSEGRSKQEVRFESALTGSGDALKARAFELLTA